jgi:hypothetical protein
MSDGAEWIADFAEAAVLRICGAQRLERVVRKVFLTREGLSQ